MAIISPLVYYTSLIELNFIRPLRKAENMFAFTSGMIFPRFPPRASYRKMLIYSEALTGKLQFTVKKWSQLGREYASLPLV